MTARRLLSSQGRPALRNYAPSFRQAVRTAPSPGTVNLQTAMAVYTPSRSWHYLPARPHLVVRLGPGRPPGRGPRPSAARDTAEERPILQRFFTLRRCSARSWSRSASPRDSHHVPGHIYPVLGPGLPPVLQGPASRQGHDLRRGRRALDPVEMTMVGTSDFPADWRKGVEEWKALDADTKKQGHLLHREGPGRLPPCRVEGRGLGCSTAMREDCGQLRDSGDRIVDTVIDSITGWQRTATPVRLTTAWGSLRRQ